MTINFSKWGSLLIFVVGILFSACNDDENDVNGTDAQNDANENRTPKYIFYFIGDGMGQPQINITEAAVYNKNFRLKTAGLGELNIQKFPVIGMQTTYAEDRYITGSAAAATALACGHKTTIGTIGMNGQHTAAYRTMAEMAKAKGMKVGIVSSVSIDHATPAGFYAHTESRNNYYTIGMQLAASGFDYFAGGGVRWNKYSGEDQKNDVNLFIDAAKANGYTYINTRSAFEALSSGAGKTIATIEKNLTYTKDACALPYVIDLDEESSSNNTIMLSEFTKKGIELLTDTTKGFFMMIEGGKIDWACHANDVVTAAHNTVEFDNAIGLALDFYEKHSDETLIVVTGDHECGGLTLGYAATGYETSFDLLINQSASYFSFQQKVAEMVKANSSFEYALSKLKEYFGLGDEDKGLGLSEYETGLLKDAYNRSLTGESYHKDEEVKVIYGGYDPFTVTATHILSNKAGIDWTSYSHTGVPIPVFAKGIGQEQFNGYYDNTDIANKIISIAKLDSPSSN